MPVFTAAARAFAFNTPLGPDAFLVEGVHGTEGLSELYRFELDLLAESDTDVPFDQVLGRAVSLDIRSTDDEVRTVHGIVARFTQGAEVRGPFGGTTMVRYRAVLVPAAWKLTRRRGCRMFQQKAVPDILAEVFAGLATRVELSDEYEPRDYCVQYRETDWAFASRLMEEEGIFYFFDHTGGGDVLVLGDHPIAHPPVPGPADLPYESSRHAARLSDRVTGWEKSQEVRSGRVTLWDHTFEVPHQNLEATADIQPRVMAGEVEHRLSAGGGGELEAYDYPAAVAQRFDGVSPGGAPQGDLRQVFPEAERTARIRMEEEAASGLEAVGDSTARHLTAGHTFTLARHFNADGKYLITHVTHRGRADELSTNAESVEAEFQSRFRCIPAGLPFRPQRRTPRPVVHGTQSAVVVGPPGEEIFTDKYGRVKVQFPWDRRGRYDADSSCWIRVSQVHAGSRWGAIDIPRAGEEVVVAFEEGDPDRPIVIGRVYNAREMPPFDLPGKAMVSGLKSNTYPGGGGNNEISMDDTKGKERMYVHAQHNQDEVVRNNQTSHVMNSRTKTIDVDETSTVKNNRTEDVGVDHTETIGNNMTIKVGNNLLIDAGTTITLQCGASKIVMTKGGMITITGTVIATTASVNASVIAPMTEIVGGVALTMAGGMTFLEGVTTHIGGATLVAVTGPKVDVAASGELVLSGNPIKLN